MTIYRLLHFDLDIRHDVSNIANAATLEKGADLELLQAWFLDLC